MKKYLRFICILLAIVTVFSFAACANGNNDDPKDTSKADNSTETNTDDPDFTDDVPTLDFGKQVVKIVGLDKIGVDDELKSDGYNNELINDAVHERNLNVQDRLNLTMDVTLVKEPHTTLTQAVKGGDEGVVDILSHSTMYAIQLVQKSYYRNLNESSYVNTSKHYWSQGYNEISSFGSEGKQYLATGAMALSMFRYMFVTIYNKDQFANKGLTDPYEIAVNGEWTLEYQQQVIQDMYIDRNSDGKLDTADYYGLITGNTVSVDPYCVAAGVELVSKNTDGEWEYNTSKDTIDKADQLCDIVRRIYENSNGTYVFKGATNDDTGLTFIIEMFTDECGLMATIQLYALETTAKNAEFDYGIVPMPKLNTAQKDYASYVQDQVTSYGITATVSDDRYEMVSAFLECAASESYRKVVSAYYGTALSYKYLQNEESTVMLGKIYDSVKFDFSGAYSNILGVVLRDQLRPLLSGNSSKALSSSLSKWTKSINKSLEKFNSTMEGLKY